MKNLNRVPQIITLYWIIKIAASTLGETGADMFSMTFNLGYGIVVLIFMFLFLVFLFFKLYSKKYSPLLYWIVFTLTAIVGTGISDFIDRTLGLGYLGGSSLLISILGLILFVWYKKEKSISVDHIYTHSQEGFYWMAILLGNTLGTAAGDFLVHGAQLGIMYSTILVTVSLIGVYLLHKYTKISGVFLFWIAFILTRPFGATFGDLLTKTPSEGGIGVGTIGASIIFIIILLFALMKEMKLEKGRKITIEEQNII